MVGKYNNSTVIKLILSKYSDLTNRSNAVEYKTGNWIQQYILCNNIEQKDSSHLHNATSCDSQQKLSSIFLHSSYLLRLNTKHFFHQWQFRQCKYKQKFYIILYKANFIETKQLFYPSMPRTQWQWSGKQDKAIWGWILMDNISMEDKQWSLLTLDNR